MPKSQFETVIECDAYRFGYGFRLVLAAFETEFSLTFKEERFDSRIPFLFRLQCRVVDILGLFAEPVAKRQAVFIEAYIGCLLKR